MENGLVCRNQTKEISELKKTARLQKWQHELEDQKNSGLTIKDWCALHNIHPSSFYKRLKRLRAVFCEEMSELSEMKTAAPAIVPVSTISNSKAEIQIVSSGIDISINGDISAENLKAIIQSLKSCCKSLLYSRCVL